MKYKLMDDVFFKKISDELVSIIKYNDDDFIYKLESQVAKIFLLLVEGVEVSEVKAKLGTSISDETLDQIVKDLVELTVLKEQ
ncbi:MAG: hypothetical protein LW878_13660 [Proteobacteria bacterium]|nr:hypothetical protein [Pseudomonadota bacterium]